MRDESDSKWCVLGRYKQEIGTWSWVGILMAPTAERAIEDALKVQPIHGYYVALPWEIAARAETGVHVLDAEGNRR